MTYLGRYRTIAHLKLNVCFRAGGQLPLMAHLGRSKPLVLPACPRDYAGFSVGLSYRSLVVMKAACWQQDWVERAQVSNT